MRAIIALLIFFSLTACVEGGMKTASGKTILYQSGNASAGVQITITPPRTERWYAGYEFVICQTQWMLYNYIDNGDGAGCWIGPLEGSPVRDIHNGVTIWNDFSPVKPRFYTGT
ncbi:MAG: hypothetical protein RLZZ360_48 [Candidatus Parcubacteria bacterium]|jgi:hypothetical protein